MAFHPYPQVIPPVFNLGGFGPPRGLTPASACPWIDHLASRLPRVTDRPFKDSLSLRLASKLNLATHGNSLAHSTKGTPSPCHPEGRLSGLRLLVSTRFQVLFHSPLGVLFTFPSRYWFTIGHQRVFSLGGWSPRIPTGFFVPRGTWDPDPGSPQPLPYRTVTFCGAPFQTLQLGLGFLTPRPDRNRNRSGPMTPTSQRLRAIT